MRQVNRNLEPYLYLVISNRQRLIKYFNQWYIDIDGVWIAGMCRIQEFQKYCVANFQKHQCMRLKLQISRFKVVKLLKKIQNGKIANVWVFLVLLFPQHFFPQNTIQTLRCYSTCVKFVNVDTLVRVGTSKSSSISSSSSHIYF